MTPTPQEKAKELVDKKLSTTIKFTYYVIEDGICVGDGHMTRDSAIELTISEVEEILKAEPTKPTYYANIYASVELAHDFWNEVLTELKEMQ